MHFFTLIAACIGMLGGCTWSPTPHSSPATTAAPTSTSSPALPSTTLSTTSQPLRPPPAFTLDAPAHIRFYEDLAVRKIETPSAIGIQFFGDIMLDRNVAKAMGERGTDYLFENIKGENRGLDPRVDLTVANLEGPFAPARVKTTKSIAFRFDPKYATELKNAGFDAVSLANNHTLDMGWANVDFTHATLDAAGLPYFGDQLREGKEFTYVTSTPGGTIAFVGFNNTDHVMDLKKIAAVLEDAETRASTTIVMMHWGDEYKRISNTNQRTFARFLIDNGAEAVIGAHPHVIQEAELYAGKPIFYSLGNFVFDQYFSTETQEGLSLGLTFAHGELEAIYAIPFYGIKSQLFLMDGKRRDDFYAWLNKNSRLGDKKFEGGKLLLK